jgi:membrane associated rhomboid family serine protease
MVCRKKEKITILAHVIIVALSLIDIDVASMGVTSTPTIATRLVYPFLHANIFHALINCWCWYTIVKMYDTSWMRMLIAYIGAVCVPTFALSTTPTIGLSAFCFILLGATTFDVARKWYYTHWMLFYILVGFLIPNINGMIHLYGYIFGLLIGLLNYPLCKK